MNLSKIRDYKFNIYNSSLGNPRLICIIEEILIQKYHDVLTIGNRNNDSLL